MAAHFDSGELEREAKARTGLDDFGSGDWRDAMQWLLEAARFSSILPA